MSNNRIIQSSCGQQHTAVISGFYFKIIFFHVTVLDKGELFTFGLGVFGQLGHGKLKDELVPKRVESLVNEGHFIVQVALGI